MSILVKASGEGVLYCKISWATSCVLLRDLNPSGPAVSCLKNSLAISWERSLQSEQGKSLYCVAVVIGDIEHSLHLLLALAGLFVVQWKLCLVAQ